MNQDWGEKKIKELFHELRQEDERLAPSFASVWEAALSHIGTARHPWRVFRVAAAVVMLIVLGSAVVIFLREPAGPPALPKIPGSDKLITQPSSPTVPLPKPAEEALPKVARRRGPVRLRQPDILISQWRPPTDFLLRTPGEQWLRTVPQLGESLAEIRAIMPEEKN